MIRSRDVLIRGTILGLLADIIKLLVNYVAFLFGFTNAVFWQLAAAHMLQKGQLQSPAALFIGAVVDLITAGALGTAFLWLIDHVVGRQALIFKGLAFGMLSWLGLFGTLATTLENKLPQSPAGVIVTIVAHAFFGIALALLARMVDVSDTESIR